MNHSTLRDRIETIIHYITMPPGRGDFHMAEQPDRYPHTADALHYYTALQTHAEYADSLTPADPSDRPTMPPQPTCTHYQGVCEHMVCPRELAADLEPYDNYPAGWV